jgi:hypothetical protein
MFRAMLIAGVLLIGAFGPAEAEMYKGYETAGYAVEHTDGTVEVRRYPPQLVAEVTVDGDRSTAAGRGFRILAGYIFGGNTGAGKIAMTTPVTQEPAKIAMTTPVTQSGRDGQWTVRFGMPGSYTLDTLPKPKDDRIRFAETPEDRVVVITFSGLPTAGNLAEKADELRRAVARMGLNVTGDAFYMFYDSPFTLPWNRRNEVALHLR